MVATLESYGSGELAELFGVCQGSAIRMIDKGHMPSHRLGGGTFRRVLHDDLVAYCRRKDLFAQLNALGWVPSWLVAEEGEYVAAELRDQGAHMPILHACTSLFEAGRMCIAKQPLGIVLHTDLGRSAVVRALVYLNDHVPYVKTAVLAFEDERSFAQTCEPLCDKMFVAPYSWSEVAHFLVG